MYRELPAMPSVAPVVAAGWVRHGSGSATAVRLSPDGCTDLIWVDGELLVAGSDTRPHLTTVVPGATYAAVRFTPGAGPALLGVPGSELRDLRVPLAALWPDARVRRLGDRVGAATDRPAVLQAVVRDLLARTGGPDPVVAGIVAAQRAGVGVAATAGRLGLSERQLHRRCLAAFGYGAGTLARVLRFRRAVALARSGRPFAEVAAVAGYADQPHLAREVRALAGVTLRELIG